MPIKIFIKLNDLMTSPNMLKKNICNAAQVINSDFHTV